MEEICERDRQVMADAAARYREAKARHAHLGEKLKFAEAALKALSEQCYQAHDEVQRALSALYHAAAGEPPAKAKEPAEAEGA